MAGALVAATELNTLLDLEPTSKQDYIQESTRIRDELVTHLTTFTSTAQSTADTQSVIEIVAAAVKDPSSNSPALGFDLLFERLC